MLRAPPTAKLSQGIPADSKDIVDEHKDVSPQGKRKRDEHTPSRPVQDSRERSNLPPYKTVLCRHWKVEGKCEYGDKCRFAHGEAEKKPFPPDYQRPINFLTSGPVRAPVPRQSSVISQPNYREMDELNAENSELRLENTRLRAQVEILMKAAERSNRQAAPPPIMEHRRSPPPMRERSPPRYRDRGPPPPPMRRGGAPPMRGMRDRSPPPHRGMSPPPIRRDRPPRDVRNRGPPRGGRGLPPPRDSRAPPPRERMRDRDYYERSRRGSSPGRPPIGRGGRDAGRGRSRRY